MQEILKKFFFEKIPSSKKSFLQKMALNGGMWDEFNSTYYYTEDWLIFILNIFFPTMPEKPWHSIKRVYYIEGELANANGLYAT